MMICVLLLGFAKFLSYFGACEPVSNHYTCCTNGGKHIYASKISDWICCKNAEHSRVYSIDVMNLRSIFVMLIIETNDLYCTSVATVQPWGKVLDSSLASGNYSWGRLSSSLFNRSRGKTKATLTMPILA